jgi:chaperone modulatory protein CbpM
MITVQEFLLRARLEHGSLEAWISAGWIVPPQTEPELLFSDVDLARAQLIRDLREDLASTTTDLGRPASHRPDARLRRSMQDLLDELRNQMSDDRALMKTLQSSVI